MTRVPTRVVLYSYASGLPRRAAEFRWSEADGVTLDIADPEWGSIAERYLAEGVYFNAEERRVHASEGEAFMLALVQPSQSTYVGFIDQSEPGPDVEPQARGGGFTPLQAYRVLAGLPVDDEPSASPPSPVPSSTVSRPASTTAPAISAAPSGASSSGYPRSKKSGSPAN
jgi:hypothetical protein